MNATLETITPEIAEQLLQKNTRNRRVIRNHVIGLAEEIKAGRWKVNGDTICLNGDVLIDGQHRLLAVVEAKMPIVTWVVRGVDSCVFDTKDVGRRRSAADTLSVHGEVNCRNLAAALVFIDRYFTGRLENRGHRYSNSEVEELLQKYPEARRGASILGRKLLPPSILQGLLYLFGRVDEADAQRFIDDVLQGSNLTMDDPVYRLRERLLQNSLSKAKLTVGEIAALCIKAWNMRRAGKPCRILKWTGSGPTKEEFPIIAD
jgi:hypothetical protein